MGTPEKKKHSIGFLDRLPSKLKGAVTLTLLALIMIAAGCIPLPEGQQVILPADATAEAQAVETLIGQLTEQAQAKVTETFTPSPAPSPTVASKNVALFGLLEPTVAFTKHISNDLTLNGGVQVVAGVTCQGLLAGMGLNENNIRARGDNPRAVAFAVNGDAPERLECGWEIAAQYPGVPIMIYVESLNSTIEQMKTAGFDVYSRDAADYLMVTWLRGFFLP